MVNIEVLKGLSFSGAERMLFEEGYVEEDCIEKESKNCDKLFLYPYALYINNVLVDRIFHAEYCNLDDEGEFDDFKSFWTRM